MSNSFPNNEYKVISTLSVKLFWFIEMNKLLSSKIGFGYMIGFKLLFMVSLYTPWQSLSVVTFSSLIPEVNAKIISLSVVIVSTSLRTML